MAAKNAKQRIMAIFKALLPFLVIFLVLLFVYFLWRHYQPHHKMNFHQTKVSQLQDAGPTPARAVVTAT